MNFLLIDSLEGYRITIRFGTSTRSFDQTVSIELTALIQRSDKKRPVLEFINRYILQKTEWKNVKYSYNLGRLQGTVNTEKVTRWIPGGGM